MYKNRQLHCKKIAENMNSTQIIIEYNSGNLTQHI